MLIFRILNLVFFSSSIIGLCNNMIRKNKLELSFADTVGPSTMPCASPTDTCPLATTTSYASVLVSPGAAHQKESQQLLASSSEESSK